MPEIKTKLEWEKGAFDKYQIMITKIPLFHRNIAKVVVDKQAVINAAQRGADSVQESDIVRAFFSEVPKAFYSLMIRLFDDVGFNYKEYEQKT